MKGAAEQIPVSNQDKAHISLGFALRTICIIICPEIACVPWYRRLPVCPLSVTCSSSHLTQDFPTCWKNLQCQWASLLIHIFPSAWLQFWLIHFLPLMEKNTQLFPCFAVEVQSPRCELLLLKHSQQRPHQSWHEDKFHCGPWSFHGTEETHKN